MTNKIDPSRAELRRRFGAKVKAMRKHAGLTQLDVAAYMNYSYPASVSQVECGTNGLPPYDLGELAKCLRVNVQEFGRMYTYYYEPFVYECLWGVDPFVMEGLPRSLKTVKGMPKRQIGLGND